MPTAGPRIHRASIVSDAVPGRIAHAGTALRVQSVYRAVVNITTANGLLTVASPEAGGLPNGILAELGPDWRMIERVVPMGVSRRGCGTMTMRPVALRNLQWLPRCENALERDAARRRT